MDEDLDNTQLAEGRQQHIGRLLQQAYRAFSADAITKLRARGHTHLSLVHTTLLPYIDVEGTRSSVLAERARMTKQAVGQLIGDLERAGYIERRPDPDDGRATLISFTEDGSAYLRDALAVKREIEAEYAQQLGAELWDALQGALQRLVDLKRSDDPAPE